MTIFPCWLDAFFEQVEILQQSANTTCYSNQCIRHDTLKRICSYVHYSINIINGDSSNVTAVVTHRANRDLISSVQVIVDPPEVFNCLKAC
jgi:hypothetical protein